MYHDYYSRRLREALDQAEQAREPGERDIYLRLSRHYQNLLLLGGNPARAQAA